MASPCGWHSSTWLLAGRQALLAKLKALGGLRALGRLKAPGRLRALGGLKALISPEVVSSMGRLLIRNGRILDPSRNLDTQGDCLIDGVEITIAESFPPQYFVRVTSGLPSGCVTFDAIETTRDGNTIEIAVWNLGPGPDATFACTAIYGIVENNVALGTDFESGAEYRVEVNDVVEMFTAQ